jgi:hypothetical protein
MARPLNRFEPMYLLKIKGVVSKNKKIEFNQSLSFLIKQFPPKWHKVHIANDIIHQDTYYFDSVWESKTELDEFLTNENYKVLLGAFKVLGNDPDITISEVNKISEVKTRSK